MSVDVGAICRFDNDTDASVASDAAVVAGERMAQLRVGGAFWGASAPTCRVLMVLDRGDMLPPGDLAGHAIVPRRGVLRRTISDALRRNAVVVAQDCDMWPAIDAAEQVVASANDEVAVMALAAGKPVETCAGRDLWPARGEILNASLLAGRRYRDPISNVDVDIMTMIDRLASWRQIIDANRGIAAATGIAWWKQDAIARFLWDGQPARLPFIRPRAALRRVAGTGRSVAAWPSRIPNWFGPAVAEAGGGVHWIEDGFIRSVGLGSDLIPPLSVTVDDLRPHFDPSGPSRLELILAGTAFPAKLLARSAALRQRIVAQGVGKYSATGDTDAQAEPSPRPAGRVVLVAGQVSNDLSVIKGGGAVRGNLDLLARARAAEPDSYIIFRPHPDVTAGHRAGTIDERDALRYADRIDTGSSAAALLRNVDAVHVLTSLIGFEALMRAREVVVHGQPFFAGWGLTRDLAPPIMRRGRRLTLDMLVAAALILYPRYLDPRTGLPCSVEDFLATPGGVRRRTGWLVRLRQLQGRLNFLVRQA
ncbi:beta-3-deoxy-D-manno-oct-2-ulosonic acid transferase [Sphingomonas sp. R86521]|uniref:capsular polysaccharide export protein, LipB/KpsS family n=1 Tax=Sphingomonas sp. R86521 TaxID=3093860 RepID=UPI0036D3716A